MTGEDLRKLVCHVSKENKITKELEERMRKTILRKETKRTKKRKKMGMAEKTPKS